MHVQIFLSFLWKNALIYENFTYKTFINTQLFHPSAYQGIAVSVQKDHDSNVILIVLSV